MIERTADRLPRPHRDRRPDAPQPRWPAAPSAPRCSPRPTTPRIPDAVATQLAEIFATDIDFRALRKGDRFSVVYETLDADGEPITWGRTGRVLAAEFVNNGKTYSAMWFKEPGQKGGYYGLDGQSKRRAFLAARRSSSRA